MSDGPVPICRTSELAEADSFWTRDVGGTPVLVTRDGHGTIRAFANVCRHRGVRLVHEQRGVAKTFTCLFHGWMYDAEGQMGGPPLLYLAKTNPMAAAMREGNALVALPSAERHGFVWAAPRAGPALDVAAFLGAVDLELSRRGVAALVVEERSEETFDSDVVPKARARMAAGDALFVPSDDLAFVLAERTVAILSVSRRRAEDDFGDVRDGPETSTLETLVLRAAE